ncbi:MAG TPA: pyridoxal-phosphate dependent enzyme, partial [Candidatus Thermoplasmatota archaeon]
MSLQVNGRSAGPAPIFASNVLELVGNTPLVKLHRIPTRGSATVFAKLESRNPGGSVKDRIGLRMVEDGERAGALHPGGTIVEPTSGNTGVGLALAATLKGYRLVCVMPDKVPIEKRRLLELLGAEVVVCPTAVAPEDPRSYYSVSRRLVLERKGFQPNQYANPANPGAHYQTTGPEIWRDMGEVIDAFVCGVGTGGTITGTGRYLKEKNPSVRVVGIDPQGSILKEAHERGNFESKPKTYLIDGIGEDFVPPALDMGVVDEFITVTDR